MRQKRVVNPQLRKFVLFAIALISLYGGYYWGNQHAPKNQGLKLIQLLSEPRIINSFQLSRAVDKTFTDYNLKGHWNLVFLGYTGEGSDSHHQLTLAIRILNRLAQWPKLQKSVQVVFVTVDPERDTPEKLKSHVAQYNKDFIALSGEQREITALATQLGMRFSRVVDERGGYTINHSSSIALVNPEGKWLGLFTGRVDASNIAADIKQLADDS